jgi:AraC-like DNA-binding protein
MPLIVQLYVLTISGYLIISCSKKDILSNSLLKKVFVVLIYAAGLRVALGLNLAIPVIFQDSVFLAYSLFVPGAYLCMRNLIYGNSLQDKDLVHFVPFLTLCLYGLFASFISSNIHAEIRKIWSFTEEATYDPEILMPLFLFVYCLTAFYSYKVLLLLKDTLLRKDNSLQLQAGLKLQLNDNTSEKAAMQQQTSIISQERMTEIDSIVKELLDEKKPYLQQRYSLKDLAIDTNIPLHHLSAFINKYCGKNFNDFINEFRVINCKEKILNEEYKYKKLEAIAEESGFNNRNTFAIAFKKVTGLKPSEFLRSLKSTEDVNERSYEITGSQASLQSV